MRGRGGGGRGGGVSVGSLFSTRFCRGAKITTPLKRQFKGGGVQLIPHADLFCFGCGVFDMGWERNKRGQRGAKGPTLISHPNFRTS